MTMHTQEEILPIWAAIGPDGEVLKSSVSAFKAVSQRWAIRRRNHTVVMLAQISYHVTPKIVQRPVVEQPVERVQEVQKALRFSRAPQKAPRFNTPEQKYAPMVRAEDLEAQLYPPKRPRGRPRKVA